MEHASSSSIQKQVAGEPCQHNQQSTICRLARSKGGNPMKNSVGKFIQAIAFGAALMAVPVEASAATFAVWLDGSTTPGGGGNGILTSLDQAFGPGSYTLVSTANLETSGFLNSFDTL